MNIRHVLMIFTLSLFVQVSLASDSQLLKVDFDHPEKFSDFKSRENINHKNQEKLMSEMRKLMTKSATKTLGKNIQLEIVVKNVEMAGRFVYPGGSIDLRNNVFNNDTRAVRVVKDSDKASLKFEFKLLDENGKILKQGDELLSTRNLKLLSRSKLKYRRGNFNYIMPLFDAWLIKL